MLDPLQAIYSLIVSVFGVLKSVLSAGVALVSQLPAVVQFLQDLPNYVPSFVVAFLGAGVFGSVVLIILSRKS